LLFEFRRMRTYPSHPSHSGEQAMLGGDGSSSADVAAKR
jgi:hypothetical protein